MAMVFCRSCAKQLHDSAPTCVQCGAPQAHTSVATSADAMPDGIRGWSWGGFLLTWIWAIGNRTWWGLLGLVPYVNIGVAVWLGVHGREMAWKNGAWDSVEHFNRVQRAWSKWALIVWSAGVLLIGVVAWNAKGAFESAARHATVETSVEADEQASEDTPAPKTAPVVQQL